MKSIYKSLILAAALGGSLSSCNDFLTVDPVDKLTQDNFYTRQHHGPLRRRHLGPVRP